MANIAKGQNQPCDFHTRGKTYASARHWSPAPAPGAHLPHHSRINVSRDGPFSFSGINSTKASTMDGDKRRLFLERMKANPFFKKSSRAGVQDSGNPVNKSTGVEILTDDEVGTVSSEDPHGHMSLFLHHQHEQQAKHFQHQQSSVSGASSSSSSQRPKFDLKGPVYGYRSLSNGSRVLGTTASSADKSSSLFANVEDEPPLMMSSIDGVTTQVISTCTSAYKGRLILVQIFPKITVRWRL